MNVHLLLNRVFQQLILLKIIALSLVVVLVDDIRVRRSSDSSAFDISGQARKVPRRGRLSMKPCFLMVSF